MDSVRGALLGCPDLGSRLYGKAGHWNGLGAAEKRVFWDVGVTGLRRFAGCRVVAGQLRALGQLRYDPAVDMLVGLREECPVVPIQVAAAYVLVRCSGMAE